MAIRIGVGFGGWPFSQRDPTLLWWYVDAAEALDIHSIWLSDRVVSSTPSMEPLVARSFVAARTTKLKFGTSVLALPLRNPTVLAKEIATLDSLVGPPGPLRSQRAEAEKLAQPYMLRRRSDVDYRAFSAFGNTEDVVELVDRYVDAGATKFVARPACPPELMQEQLELLGREIVPRYHKVTSVH